MLQQPAPREQFVFQSDAIDFAERFAPGSIDLLLFDPPYYKIVRHDLDNQWTSVQDFVAWFVRLLRGYRPKLKPNASVVFFGALGSHGVRPFQRVMMEVEEPLNRLNLTYRNCITWKKRRGYGKSHDYLFCREEIAWYSANPERTGVTFNIPYLNEKRGYEGWNKDYPAKSEYKRVSNVFADIGEVMHPKRTCQKPVELLARLVNTHSNPGDLVVDPFSGWGTTGIASVLNGRDFLGCEAMADWGAADTRIVDAYNNPLGFTGP